MSLSTHNAKIEQEIRNYKPSKEAIELVRAVPFLQIIGITGAGKDTVKRELLNTGRYHHIVSHTTRNPRADNGIMEVDGVDYHFIDHATALHMLQVKGFVEAKWVHGSNLYGTSVSEFHMAKDEGKVAITDIDLQGVDEYLKISDKVYPLFLVPPSYEVWLRRLESRYQDDWHNHESDIKKRMLTAEKELERVLSTEQYLPIVNDDLTNTLEWATKIINGAKLPNSERERVAHVMQSILKQIREKRH